MAEKPTEGYHLTNPIPESKGFYAHEVAAMTRAYRIRGVMLPLVGLVSALLICVLTLLWYPAFAGALNPIACLVLGILISLFAIPCHLLGGSREVIRIPWVKSLLYASGILLNTMGTSLCITAYYLHLQAAPSVSEMAAVMAAVLLLLGAAVLFMQVIPQRYGVGTGISSLLALVGGVVSVVFWIRNDEKALWSLGFFLLLWGLIDLIALHVACSDEDSPWLRFASFAAFGLLMVVAAVVLLILICAAGDCDCDGGCCDGCDCGIGGKAKGGKRRK